MFLALRCNSKSSGDFSAERLWALQKLTCLTFSWCNKHCRKMLCACWVPWDTQTHVLTCTKSLAVEALMFQWHCHIYITVKSLTINSMICLWVVFNMEASLPWGVMVCTGLAGDLTFHMVKVPSEWLQINCFPSWCQATEWIAYTGWRILLSY